MGFFRISLSIARTPMCFHKWNPFYVLCVMSVWLLSCSDPGYAPTVGEASDAIEETWRDVMAESLCRWTNGGFPNWGVYARFQPVLSREEWHAMKRVASAFEKRISPPSMPLYFAKSQFLADHTTCALKFKKTSAQAVEYVYMQTSPYLPFLPEKLPDMSRNASAQAAWYDQIVSHDQGETHDEVVRILMVKQDDRWITHTQIAQNYADPIDAHDAAVQFHIALEEGRFDEAEWLRLSLCSSDASCSAWDDMITSARETFREIASVAQKTLVIESQKMTYVSYDNMSPYTSSQLVLTNNGPHVIRHIMMRTHTQPPQTCLLQNTRHQRTDDPVILRPGETVTAYCALSENTLPMEKLTWFYFHAE